MTELCVWMQNVPAADGARVFVVVVVVVYQHRPIKVGGLQFQHKSVHSLLQKVALERKKNGKHSTFLMLDIWTADRVSATYYIFSVHISDLIGPDAHPSLFFLPSSCYRTINRA